MKTFRDSLNERLKDENFKKEYEQIHPEMEIIKTLVAVRREKNMTKSELAEGLGMQLKIEFVPMAKM